MTNLLWTERYRPKTLAECILPVAIKKQLKSVVRKKELPNMMFFGPPGTGKTTAAIAIVEAIGAQWLAIPGSLSRNIDTLRGEVTGFASTVSMVEDGPSKKYVIIDEADYLNPQSTQPALRNFMDEYSSNCGFIFTCNYPNKLIEPVRSRFAMVDFRIPKEEKVALMKEMMERICTILEAEGVEYDTKVVGHMLLKYYPDWRKLLNELQMASNAGPITKVLDDHFLKISELVAHLKTRNFTAIRKWAGEIDLSDEEVFRAFYDNAITLVDDPASLVVLIGEYQYKSAFVADKEINLAAFLAQVMSECKFVNG